MSLTLKITNQESLKASAQGTNSLELVYCAAYEQGDTISLETTEPCFLVLCLEDSLAPMFVYLAKNYQFPIPFDAGRISYSPKCFTSDKHFLFARYASAEEIAQRKNLCLNVFDHHHNTGMFPHSFANVETRNEAVFASRNAIDGVCASGGHGPYPFQSWGINQQADAEITIDFGRAVDIDTVGIVTRSDYPHDNWWHTVTLRFSDGTSEQVSLEKIGAPQRFSMIKKDVTSMTMCDMKKDETDPSPFPALMQLEAFGVEHV